MSFVIMHSTVCLSSTLASTNAHCYRIPQRSSHFISIVMKSLSLSARIKTQRCVSRLTMWTLNNAGIELYIQIPFTPPSQYPRNLSEYKVIFFNYIIWEMYTLYNTIHTYVRSTCNETLM